MWDRFTTKLLREEEGTPVEKIKKRLLRVDNAITTVIRREDVENGQVMLVNLRIEINLSLREMGTEGGHKYYYIRDCMVRAINAINAIYDFGVMSMFFEYRDVCEEVKYICSLVIKDIEAKES